MKIILILVMISMFTFFPCFASNQLRITGGVCIDTTGTPDFEMICTELSTTMDNQFWGLGWEMIFHKLGIGGNYYANFEQDEFLEWSLQWYSEVFFLSYHFLGANIIIDPFLQAGLGSAGRVYLGEVNIYPQECEDRILALSIFPFVSAGLVIHFSGFLVGGKLSYIPAIGPVPVTAIPRYHLNDTQLLVFVGVSF